MHKRLIEEGFNRRYVLLPLVLAILLVVVGFAVTEVRRAKTRVLADELRERQDVIRVLADTAQKAMEAESAQRGFLLTGEPKYLPPMETGLAAARSLIADLVKRYEHLNPDEIKVLQGIQSDLDVKTGEMRQSVGLLKDGKPREALAVVKSDLGLYQMFAINEALQALRVRERARVLAGLNAWSEATRQNFMINLAGALFTIVVLVIMGLMATRDIRRREGFATDLAAQIDARTAELQELSQHMSRVAEAEKHALARELHDELGGLLVAMRMDISQIRKRLPAGNDPDLAARWERVEQALAGGLALKRRVIEELRPTLLDNMGLFAALRWLAGQSAEQAQLKLEMVGLDDEVELPPEVAIAAFRTAQEAIANVIKHAQATTLVLRADVGERLALRISDDGRGVPEGAARRTGSHGLKQMRFRMEAVGGTLRLEPNTPHGTAVFLSVPLA